MENLLNAILEKYSRDIEILELKHREELRNQGMSENRETTPLNVEGVLHLPNDIKELNDVEYKSIRISRELINQFNKVADKHKQFTKTSLINLALKEFIVKYR